MVPRNWIFNRRSLHSHNSCSQVPQVGSNLLDRVWYESVRPRRVELRIEGRDRRGGMLINFISQRVEVSDDLDIGRVERLREGIDTGIDVGEF